MLLILRLLSFWAFSLICILQSSQRVELTPLLTAAVPHYTCYYVFIFNVILSKVTFFCQNDASIDLFFFSFSVWEQPKTK